MHRTIAKICGFSFHGPCPCVGGFEPLLKLISRGQKSAAVPWGVELELIGEWCMEACRGSINTGVKRKHRFTHPFRGELVYQTRAWQGNDVTLQRHSITLHDLTATSFQDAPLFFSYTQTNTHRFCLFWFPNKHTHYMEFNDWCWTEIERVQRLFKFNYNWQIKKNI